MVCEFCKSSYNDNRLELCPGCGAKLTKIPDPPRIKPPPPPLPKDTKQNNGIRWAYVLLAVVVTITVIGWSVKALLFAPSTNPADDEQSKTVEGNTEEEPGIEEPEEPLFAYGLMPQISGHIWPNEELTRDVVEGLTYLRIFENDGKIEVAYGLNDPFAAGFEPESFSVNIEKGGKTVVELKPFKGLKKLETNIRVAPSSIETLLGLKHLACSFDAADFSGMEGFTSLESLIISGGSLKSLEGIENLTALTDLSLERANITDLTPLSQLKGLTSLTVIRCNEIQNLGIIGDLGGLTSLSVINFDSTDFGFIGKLKLLERLTFSDTKTKSLAFVGELPNLEYLCIGRNSDAKIIPSFERFKDSLTALELDATYLEDVDFLTPLTNLENLKLYNPSSLRPLSGMKKLTELTISPGRQVETLAPIGNLSSLKKLTFEKNMGFTPWDNSVFSFLSNLTELEELSFGGCGLYFNANPVYSLKNLKSLDFSGNTVCGNFSDIKNLTNLERLWLAKTNLAKSFWYETDGFISSIGIDGEMTMQSQVSSISALPNLRELGVSGTELQDISFLKNLQRLERFYANDNYITDVFALSELPDLKYADLSSNAVTNWETLDSLKNAEIIGKP